MTLSELTTGSSFYFPEWPEQIFIYAGNATNKQQQQVAKCVPCGKLYPKYFSLKKEMIRVNI